MVISYNVKWSVGIQFGLRLAALAMMAQIVGCTSERTCDDGNACNGVETFGSDDACVDGDPKICPDGEVCVDPEGTCQAVCESDTDCNDDDPCTEDMCFMLTDVPYCIYSTDCGATTVSCPCDDNNLCTAIDVCMLLGACGGTPILCPDGGTCDPATGSCTGGESSPSTSLQEAFGSYTGETTCFDNVVHVTFRLDGSSFFLVGLDGDNRLFFPDSSEDSLTATAMDVTVFGFEGNTVTLSVDNNTGEVSLQITSDTGDVLCNITLIPN